MSEVRKLIYFQIVSSLSNENDKHIVRSVYQNMNSNTTYFQDLIIDIGRHFLLMAAFFLFSGQMVLLDRFFDGTFFTYGIEVMSFADRDQEDRIDPVRFFLR